MNKLEVAIKLLQLLNERKTITSKVVSDELNTSVRTAQRYLRELSTLPCVVTKENKGYELYPNYKLKEALLNTSVCDLVYRKIKNSHLSSGANEVICLVCGTTRNKQSHADFIFDGDEVSNNRKLKQLTTTISEMLKDRACSFPDEQQPLTIQVE